MARPSNDVFRRHSDAHKRFFWNVAERLGSKWSTMTGKQIERELRMVSHRRAI